MLPSLYAAMLTPYFLKGVKECIVPFLLPIVLLLVMSRSLFSSWSSYIMLAMMVVSVGYVYLLHKKDPDQSAEKMQKEDSKTE